MLPNSILAFNGRFELQKSGLNFEEAFGQPADAAIVSRPAASPVKGVPRNVGGRTNAVRGSVDADEDLCALFSGIAQAWS